MPRVKGYWPGKPRLSRKLSPFQSRGVYSGLISMRERFLTARSVPIWLL
jgi:hypothetical protein